MLRLYNITKEYKVDEDSVLALNNVSIEFRKNEFVAILGPSGCGKTTLLNIVGGLDRYTSGDIQIDGISTKEYDDVDWDTYRNRRIGFVFQSYNLIPHLNILKNVSMSLTLAGVEKEEIKARAMEALRKVGLESQAKKKPNQLSGGQMQRVAIARALVNNPEIILADEPTGALDSESGIQVMDLLKEVAQDRLVIMVTHNPQLAEEYSTRIVYLKDGEIEGDTMPYDSSKDESIVEEVTAPIKKQEAVAEEGIKEEKNICCCKEGKIAKFFTKLHTQCKQFNKKLKEKAHKWKKADRAAMKLSTAITLSWGNLLAKKGRTLLTSIAGSIGIIGIVLVLSLSNGASNYVAGLEESALSTYPLSVSKSSLDVTNIMTQLMGFGGGGSDKKEVIDDQITAKLMLGNFLEMFGDMDEMQEENDLHALKQKIDSEFNEDWATVKYNYGTSFNVYVKDPGSDVDYMKTVPYAENMYTLFGEIDASLGGILSDMTIDVMGESMSISDAMAYLSGMLGDPWAEISTNQALVESQYEVIGGNWPTKANEVVVVVNSDNTLYDYQLFMLGLKSSSDLGSLLGGDSEFVAKPYSIDEILSLEYKILSNVDYLDSNGDDTWTMSDKSTLEINYVDSHAMQFADGTDTVKVVGVVRPKEGAIASSIGGVIGYTSELSDALLLHSENHEAVKAMKALYDSAVENDQDLYESVVSIYKFDFEGGIVKRQSIVEIGNDVSVGESKVIGDEFAEAHDTVMRELGFIDTDYPQSIDFYCTSFESKEFVAKFLDDAGIKYSDSLSSMMSFVNTMVDTITGVLVGFAAISLVVSTIMIAIIIYTSVLERRKEIGVLRSIGARKKDISRVFIAESAILGGYSGLIGVLISVVICFIASYIIEVLLGIVGLVSVSWWHCLVMFAVSVVLSMLAGFIPSRIASNKDPAIALRSE